MCKLFLTLDLSKANIKTILMQLLTGLSKDVNTETYALHKRLKVAATVFYFLSVASNSCKLNIAFDSSMAHAISFLHQLPTDISKEANTEAYTLDRSINVIATVLYFLTVVSYRCRLLARLAPSKPNAINILWCLLTGISQEVNTETYTLHKSMVVAATAFYFLKI